MLNEVKRSGLFEYIEVITEVKLLTIGGKLNKALWNTYTIKDIYRNSGRNKESWIFVYKTGKHTIYLHTSVPMLISTSSPSYTWS